MLRRISLTLLALVCALVPASAQERFITLASTTSTEQSGLFGHIIPLFRRQTGIDVRVVALGTGQALALAARGDADAVLVHDRTGEERFVAEGHGLDRREVMFNDFVIVGPKADPARISGASDVGEALRRIAAAGAPFASRGDDSGTHRMEMRLWSRAGVADAQLRQPWRRELGSGMGPTLNTASGLSAYALADRATWASFRNRGDLAVLSQGDAQLLNRYGSILVNPAKGAHIKASDARRWHEWLSTPEGRAAISSFRIEGEQLFFIAADSPRS
ncbi:MAG: substrate-binding domain-containing protein [Beijerinckiaceae bacterium]